MRRLILGTVIGMVLAWRYFGIEVGALHWPSRPERVRETSQRPGLAFLYRASLNKWWFDDLNDLPFMRIGGRVAAATLAFGLSTREVEHRAHAVHGFAMLVPAGRMSAEAVAAGMTTVAGHCTATRWAATLRDAATKAVALPDVQEAMARQGLDVETSTPQELGARIRRETATWAAVIKEAGIKAE